MWTIFKGRLPRRLSGKESVCWCRRSRRHRFNPWVGKIPWRREWLPTLVFLPEESHGQRSLEGLSQRVRHYWARAHTHTHTFLKSVKFVTTSLLFHVLVLWPHGMWHLSSPTRNQTLALCIERWSLNHCTTRESWWVRFDRLQNVSLEYVTKNLVYDITFWLYLEEDWNLMKDFNLNKIKFAFLKRSLCHLKEDTSVTSALIISFW